MSVKRINVVRLTLQETGTYNIQYYRPYNINVTKDSLHGIQNCIENIQINGNSITPGTLATLGEEVVVPQAAPQAPIAIPGGWENKRIRFVLVVEIESNIGTVSVYHVQGFTDHLGISQNGHVDPRMRFYINSIFQLNRKLYQTPAGPQYVDSLQNCSHLLVSPSTLDPACNLSLYTLRPMDLFTYMQSSITGIPEGNGYDSSMESIIQGQRNNALVLDTRLYTPTDFYRPSSRLNNSPLQFLSDTINSGIRGIQSTSNNFITGFDQTLEAARNIASCREMAVKDTDLMQILNKPDYLSLKGISSVFTLDEIEKVDPNLRNVTNYLPLDVNARAHLHQSGVTSHWTGSDKETQVAVMLANSIPTLMSECLVSRIHFVSTNHSINGQISTTIIDAKSLSNVPLPQMLDTFKFRFESELVQQFTYHNQLPYTLEVRCDMFGETYIKIALYSTTQTEYVVPSFCDSLISPIMNVDFSTIAVQGQAAQHILDTVQGVQREFSTAPIVVNHGI